MSDNILKYERPAITADCVLFATLPDMQCEEDNMSCSLSLCVRLTLRNREPEAGKWALLGAFVPIDERVEDVMVRAAAEKGNVAAPFYAEQLAMFDMPGRDERWRVISEAYKILRMLAGLPLMSRTSL